MLIELPVAWLVALNVLGWPVIHIAVAWGVTQLPINAFNPQSWLFRPRSWENGGEIYKRHFAIKAWKEFLPDAASWFRKGFQKTKLAELAPDYLERFIQETCRSEMAHWITMAAAPIFFLWNYWWVDLIMVVYAVIANLPCILTQRYNRLRLTRLLWERKRRPR
ncbi:MAG: glycosyl-4,4'-diaponeurosporenoate acyltransferase [Verrucomicrobia bacterium]|nr:glycosyl-4,4'-diaponeurosporenoate acyltransferase [Verrucomicrobiota bacterium]